MSYTTTAAMQPQQGDWHWDGTQWVYAPGYSGAALGVDPGTTAMVWSAVSTASMAASAYHGYKRNDSVGWAIWWGLMGAMFPVITPAIGVAQGFGKRK